MASRSSSDTLATCLIAESGVSKHRPGVILNDFVHQTVGWPRSGSHQMKRFWHRSMILTPGPFQPLGSDQRMRFTRLADSFI